jgi:aromatic-L-amino-acid decarboxylase
VIQGTASEAVLTALVAARQRASVRQRGSSGEPLHCMIYASTQAHSSVIKAAMIAGLASGPEDRTHVRLIPTDANYAMRADLLEAAMREDAAAARTPAFVCATIGTTGSTAVDPVDEIGRVCGAHRAWLHVDAAFAGTALLCPEHRWMSRGVELADSFCFNPHKWMLTSFDCSCLWVRDRGALTSALSITPEYLRNAATQSGRVIDYRDWQIPLGRRFRSLKLWMVIRHYGVEGLCAYVREHVRLGEMFEGWVRADSRFEVVTPRVLSLVCFRLRPRSGESPAETDARNQRLLGRLNESGKLYLTHTVLPPVQGGHAEPRLVLRLAIGGAQTREEHVRAGFHLVSTLAE